MATKKDCAPCNNGPPLRSGTGRVSLLFHLGFLASVVILLAGYRHSPVITTLGITFVAIFFEALPFMLLGALLGGCIEVFVPQETLVRLLPPNRWQSVCLAAAAGLLLPVCECAIVPVVRRLLGKGLPLGAGVGFLLGAPIVNPLVALSTAVAYGYNGAIAIHRLLIGYGIAVLVGLAMDRLFDKDAAVLPEAARGICSGQHLQKETSFGPRLAEALKHGAADFLDMGRFLVFGAFIAAGLQTLVARDVFAGVAQSTPLSVLAMMILAVLLNLCSEADAFVAAAFRTTVPMAAQMAFMVLGPMLDVKLVLMATRVFRKPVIAALAGLTAGVVFLAMITYGWLAG